MTTPHSGLTGSDLHENKGVSAATDNTVATASSGATVWQKLTASHLTGTGNPFGGQLLHVRDEQTAGTAGGTANAAAWTTARISQSKTNEITSATVNTTTYQLSLPAGTYFVNANKMFRGTGKTQIRLYNVTDSATLVVGMSHMFQNAFADSGIATMVGRFTLSGTKTLEVMYHCVSNSDTNDLGYAKNAGEVEVYMDLMIWKVA